MIDTQDFDHHASNFVQYAFTITIVLLLKTQPKQYPRQQSQSDKYSSPIIKVSEL